ncbi:restriction endonuclease subunit S [Trueperella abortisuis]|uniref:Type I restriction enzyme S subunit n=1 Tax=Trueperella abortisuis TaxID=445930 RepID=A0ABT9PG42_9ACTO|nr:restriction endonuclease subunit S [Trueperella abortisuis]MDP9831683.1 type I restriction enzyme S subunit [Trueperella abortisuis]
MLEERNVPQIRFKGFTEPWEQRQLGEMGSTYGGMTGKTKEDFGHGGAKYVSYTNIFNNPVADPTDFGVTEVDPRQNRVHHGDALFTISSETPEEVGLSSVWLSVTENLYLNSFCFGFRQDGSFNSFYLAYMLRSKSVRDRIILLAQGISRFNISKGKVMEIEVSVPQIGEQKKVGNLLHDVDQLIALHQRKLDRLKSVKKSLLEKMFPKPDSDVPEIRFVGFTDPWEQRQLGDTVEVCSGRDYKHLPAGRIPVYGTGGYMTSVSAALSYARDAVGIGRKGTIDRPYKLVAPFWTVDTLFFSIPREGNDLDFLLGVFLRIDWKSKNEATGLPSLSKQTINEIEVFIPEATEQSRIGHVFAKLDNLITLHQRKLDILGRIKKSLLEKMFV